jgi:hypothetical protein
MFKTLNITGFGNMANLIFHGVKSVMFVGPETKLLNAVLNRLARRLNPRPAGRRCHTRPTANPLG